MLLLPELMIQRASRETYILECQPQVSEMSECQVHQQNSISLAELSRLMSLHKLAKTPDLD
jgi:hypothetical protein